MQKKKIIPHYLRSTRYASGTMLKNWEYHGEQNRHGFSIQGAYTYMWKASGFKKQNKKLFSGETSDTNGINIFM